jgi:nucleoside-diphosphate-sugar epimerase
LVTGGTGFIGQYVCAELASRGYEPVVLDRLGQHGLHDTVIGDVRDRVAVEGIIGTVDGVIHLAGQLGTQETVRHPHTAAETNVMGTLNVLAAAHAYGLPMVNISVGNWWMNNPYSISKNCAERFCLMFRKELQAKVSVVRALNAYGPGQKAAPVRKIVPTFIAQALAGEPIQVYGDGTSVMDMIHVRDVAHVLVRALEVLPEGVVEAGTGRATTVNEIARAVLDEVQGEGEGFMEHIPMRPGEDDHSVVLADTSTLEPLDLTREFTSLEDGLRETVAYYAPGVPA